MFPDYYKILGIDQAASQEEIEKAFERKTKFWHPYENPSAQDIEKMTNLLEAKFILTDPQTRQKYDRELALYKDYLRGKQATGAKADDYVILDKSLVFDMRNARVRAQHQIDKELPQKQETNNWSAKGCLLAFLKGFFLMIGMSLLYMLLLKACGQL